MQWSNWKSWALVAAALVAAFAIYAFISPGSSIREAKATPKPQQVRAQARPVATARPVVVGKASGTVEPVHMEWLEPRSGSYKTSRNIFAFVQPPPPPLPPPPKPPPPPPDRDKDGIPDFRDNCPDVKNPDQQDIDRNGIGTACEGGRLEVPPPPPPVQPPMFPYKYIGTFGTSSHPIATFVSGNEIINVRKGQTFGGKFILLNIGIESVDIGFVGFPRDVTRRIPVGG